VKGFVICPDNRLRMNRFPWHNQDYITVKKKNSLRWRGQQKQKKKVKIIKGRKKSN
jgi:hypothetical protein